MTHNLHKILQERILVLDGAMGTMIQSYGLTEEDFRGERFRTHQGPLLKGCNDLLSLTRPDIITDVYRRYLEAGADLIETNTFNANGVSMADYELADLVREINLTAVRLAREVADKYSTPQKPRFVIGSVGPTSKTLSMSQDANDPAARSLSFEEMRASYRVQMEGLLEGGVDGLLIETIFDTLNAKAALIAAEEAMQHTKRKAVIMLSATVSDSSGRLLSGQTLSAWLTSIWSNNIFSVGLNCSFGARDLLTALRGLAAEAPCFVSAFPNAGLPNEMGEYDQTAPEMMDELSTYLDEHIVNIVGGCCGTTDAHIALLADLVRGRTPRTLLTATDKPLVLSGLERLTLSRTAFTPIGERLNVAGSRKFLRLIQEEKYEECLTIARSQIEAGALILDINMDDALLDATQEMTHFLRLLAAEPDIARMPIMIDSSKWEVICAGLENVQGKAIVNSISLKEGEEVFLQRARHIMQHKAAVVVMAFDESGQADTYERKIEVCARAYRLLVEQLDFPPQDIIFDPNVLAIATGMPEHDRYALDFIQAAKWITTHLPHAQISGGVSNLSFSFRGNNYLREAMHSVFLYHACKAGLNMGIVNASAQLAYEDIPLALRTLLEDVLLYRRPKEATEELIEKASFDWQQNKNSSSATSGATGALPSSATQQTRASLSVEERLAHALRTGNSDHLQEDVREALAKYGKAVNIIEGPMMAGMAEVGRLFGEGKMFLPQVVKAARTMKQAVAILQPYMEADRLEPDSNSSGRVLIATVKGDVHDIGKNIVGVVLSCNNFEVIDMGTMVSASEIVRCAQEKQVDIVALSGLITPSLEEMALVARSMEEANLCIPLLIGGATTSPLHTALRLAPAYKSPVVHVKDAAEDVHVIHQLLNAQSRSQYIQELATTQAHLRDEYESRKQQPISLTEARKRKLRLFDKSDSID